MYWQKTHCEGRKFSDIHLKTDLPFRRYVKDSETNWASDKKPPGPDNIQSPKAVVKSEVDI